MVQQISLSLEYNTQTFHITLLKIKMINDTLSSSVTDFKTQLVVNKHL